MQRLSKNGTCPSPQVAIFGWDNIVYASAFGFNVQANIILSVAEDQIKGIARVKLNRFKTNQLARVLLALGLVLVAQPLGMAKTKGEDEFTDGVNFYTKHDYATATDLFWHSIQDGNGTASTWLYMAHSKAGQGKLVEARADYESVIKLFKDSEQAKVAAAWIKALDAKTWRPAHEQLPTAPEKPGAKATPPAEGFRTRLDVLPASGHPKVSARMIATIKQTIEGLPKSVYKTLDEGGAKIFLAANVIDKWPDCINMPRPGSPDQSIADEPGRTYGRDIYVYERPLFSKATKELGDARDQQEIKASFLRQVGRVLDDCTGNYSRDPSLRTAYTMDVNSLDDRAKIGMEYYLLEGNDGPAEACAEAVCTLLGGRHKDSERFEKNFPRTESWVKTRLRL